jgi:hypothetical protein
MGRKPIGHGHQLLALPVADFAHRRAERFEVVVLGLIDEDIAVAQKRDASAVFFFFCDM